MSGCLYIVIIVNIVIMSSKKDRSFAVELVVNDPRLYMESLYLSEIHEVLGKFMKLGPSDIDGLAPIGAAPKCFEVRVKDMETWQRKKVDNMFGIIFPLSTGKSVKVFKAYEELTSVIVKGVPLGWEDDRINMIFSWYGDVRKVEETKWRTNDKIAESGTYARAGVVNGSVRVLIRLNKSIPSSLTIDNRRIEVYYRSQELSCYKCGKPHTRQECRV